ncbi:MAG: TolC family protein [Spirosomataceae bacterium]
MIRSLLIWGGLLFSLTATAQTDRPFSYLDFYQLVLTNHPVIKQAQLVLDDAQAELMMARGQFDPKLESNFERKSVNDKLYFSHWETALKVPVWGGIDLKMAREENGGDRLNPEFSDRVNVIGLNVPLGRGMLLDQRRNILKQARIYQKIAQAEQQKMINKIMYDAAKDYWEWYYTYQNYQLQKEGYELALNRFKFLRTQVLIGEKAGRDSVEAAITVQAREVDLAQAKLDFDNFSLFLSNYLWNADGNPVELPEGTVPPPTPSRLLDESVLNRFLELAKNSHPEILKLSSKLDQLRVEERFAKEFLKPRLDVQVNAIQSPLYAFSEYSVLRTNHKYGVTFEFPLFLRKERAKIQQVQIKQNQASLERTQMSREILNDVQAFYNEAVQMQKQLVIQQKAAENQVILVNAELELFQLGESSLFLINSRESKLIEMKTKVEALKSKLEKSIAGLAYAAGQQSF